MGRGCELSEHWKKSGGVTPGRECLLRIDENIKIFLKQPGTFFDIAHPRKKVKAHTCAELCQFVL